jgi:hypothetical protein
MSQAAENKSKLPKRWQQSEKVVKAVQIALIWIQNYNIASVEVRLIKE